MYHCCIPGFKPFSKLRCSNGITNIETPVQMSLVSDQVKTTYNISRDKEKKSYFNRFFIFLILYYLTSERCSVITEMGSHNTKGGTRGATRKF